MISWVDRFDPQVEEIIHSSIRRSRALGLSHKDEAILAAEALTSAMPDITDVDASLLPGSADLDERESKDWTVAVENFQPSEDGEPLVLDEWVLNL